VTLTDSSDAFHVFGAALKGTRVAKCEEALDRARVSKSQQKRKVWDAEERKREVNGGKPRQPPPVSSRSRLTRAESDAVVEAVRAVSLIDYIYRLRVKANYGDMTMFVEGPDSDSAAIAFLGDLHLLSAASLLAHELRIARILGKGVLAKEMRAWAGQNCSSAAHSLLTLRCELVTELV